MSALRQERSFGDPHHIVSGGYASGRFPVVKSGFFLVGPGWAAIFVIWVTFVFFPGALVRMVIVLR